MRFLAIGLMATVLAASLLPAGAFAADKAPPAPGQGDAKSHAQAMMEAPPLIQQTGIDCTPTDANVMSGKGTENGKTVNTKIYELVCQQGLGWMIFAPEGATPNAFDCLALSTRKPAAGAKDNGAVYCRLPPNVDPVKSLQPIVSRAASNCTLAQARWMGTSADDKLDQYEIQCTDGSANVLQVPRAGGTQKLSAVNCMDLKPGDCSYLPKDKYLAQLSAMAQPAGKPCEVNDGRYIGKTPNNHSYFEVGCTDGKSGFVLEVDDAGKFVRSIDCGRSGPMGLGCELTSAGAAQTSENATYSEAAKAIGFDCDVTSYHQFGVDSKSGREVVELACKNHPESYIALLPVDKGQSGRYMNCVRAAGVSLKCVLTPIEATYAKLSSDISKSGKSCQVSNARDVGTTAAGDDYVEVACTGGPGLVLTYPQPNDVLKASQTCTAAKATGLTCTLSK
jgi:hypothetical protein